MKPVRWIAWGAAAALVAACGEGPAPGSGSASGSPGNAPEVAVPEGLDPDGGVTFVLESRGDLSFEHTGGALCEVYQGELLVSFLQTDDPFLGYELRVPDFDGEGAYAGSLTVERNGPAAAGDVELKTSIREGDVLPVLTGTLSGTVDGELGTGVVSGSFQCRIDPAALGRGPDEDAANWVEYTVTGAASATLREPEAILCSTADDGRFMVQTLGAWVISLESAGAEPGERAASFSVAPPSHLSELREPGLDPRFRGRGLLWLRDGGKGPYGGRRVEADFEATGLRSDAGHELGVRGSFRCGVM